MNDFEHDKELQMALLNHPAIRREGIDPLWRWIAVLGWITVAILVLAMGARGETNFPQRWIAAGCMDAITGAAGTGVLAAPLPQTISARVPAPGGRADGNHSPAP